MIPIGTRCILVIASNPKWAHLVGKEAVVIGHGPGEIPELGCHHAIEFVDGSLPRDVSPGFALWSEPPDIIPIGHDPDAETRKTEREVEA